MRHPIFSTALFIVALLAASLTHADTAVSIAIGSRHVCVVLTSGGMRCWGDDTDGQLGNNSTTTKIPVPVDVVGLSSGVSMITASYHTCALTTSGGVKCWGRNSMGQLGNSTTTTPIPVDVTGLSSGVSAVSAGWYHTCALTTSGGVKCWGYNLYGELGNNTTTNSPVPVDVVGLSSGVTAIAAGGYHTCALMTSGGVKCWGYNGVGMLGNNTTTNSPVPVDVVGLSSGVSAISSVYGHTCALTTSGGMKCWGYNLDGQLGNNTTKNSRVPVDVIGLSSGVSAIAAGESSTCALTTSGGVKCWGYNYFGQLGNNTTKNSRVPVDVIGLSSGVSAIANNGNNSCALTASGGVKCWGINFYGELGNGNLVDSPVPLNVIGFGTAAIHNDFSRDGKSDVLFLNASTGSTSYWHAANKDATVSPGTYFSLNYTYAGSGDFNGDGKADLLFWRVSDNVFHSARVNSTVIWDGAQKALASYPGVSPPGFSVAAICDTDGDGKDDIVWYNATTGATRIWPAASKAAMTYQGTHLGYTIAACADFDGDGKADIFWHNATTGANQIWPGANRAGKFNPGKLADVTWTAVGAGDVDGDGKADMVWLVPATHVIRVWLGGQKLTSTYLGTGAAGFTPEAIADYDGDGKADLLWGNDTTLATQIWPAFIKANVIYPGSFQSGFAIQK